MYLFYLDTYTYVKNILFRGTIIKCPQRPRFMNLSEKISSFSILHNFTIGTCRNIIYLCI